MGNSFGRLFRITTFGESHGGGVGVVLDGCPAGTAISRDAIQRDLTRRRPGQSKLVTQRKEPDEVEILSGVKDGVALGTPIAMLVRNKDARSKDYDDMVRKFRPSHADYTYFAKYGLREAAGGGRASARETVGRVAAGAIAKTILAAVGTEVVAWVESVGDVDATVDAAAVSLAYVEATPVRCPDPAAAALMIERIDAVRKAGDSIGGVVAAVARGVPVGLGAPVFDKLEADLAKAMLSLPACKGFENGSGFAGTRMTGSAHNDPFYRADDGRIRTRKNDAGGILGGISSGEDIAIRVAFKPTSTIMREQETVDEDGNAAVLEPRGRHDPCVLPRAVPIVEAMMALVLADHLLRHRATLPV